MTAKLGAPRETTEGGGGSGVGLGSGLETPITRNEEKNGEHMMKIEKMEKKYFFVFFEKND